MSSRLSLSSSFVARGFVYPIFSLFRFHTWFLLYKKELGEERDEMRVEVGVNCAGWVVISSPILCRQLFYAFPL